MELYLIPTPYKIDTQVPDQLAGETVLIPKGQFIVRRMTIIHDVGKVDAHSTHSRLTVTQWWLLSRTTTVNTRWLPDGL